MRVLYDNLLKGATITGSSATNFGLGNMLVHSLSIPYMANDNTAQIEIGVSDTINCIALAGHNLTSLRYRLYRKNVILKEKLLVELLPTDMFYFDNTEVDKIVLNIGTNKSNAKIGYLSIGKYIQMPNPDAYYDEDIFITNKREESVFGQVYGSRGVLLKGYKVKFSFIKEIDNILKLVEDVRNYRPLFVDMTEHNHEYKQPLYCSINMSNFSYNRSPRNKFLYNVSLDIKELR